MNEKNEVITENTPAVEENMQDTPENVPAVGENIVSGMESGETGAPLEDESLDASVSLYDRLVRDIADKLKEDASLEEPVQDESNTPEELSPDNEITGEENNVPVLYVLPEKDVSSNDVSEILDYLKTREVNTSLGMPFSEAYLSDLSVTDGLLLICLVLFLFRWIYDFGKGLLS